MPQPLHLVIGEFTGGNGGGLGFWKGFGGEDFNWWGKGRKKYLDLLMLVVVFLKKRTKE
ncbi:hypothetical protein HS088_TW12G01056 [Tripterygium wilfordii]|uniref:Uncharacterized protein n=1 Tax=Tripterygium wilfordii TaxID=458696 RepID=A0A7J7D0F6_TRIWF|nr:hypothetical protein HS088_TW12G01056 [Tripterygium wilfordii]